jgi:hypothetical protein
VFEYVVQDYALKGVKQCTMVLGGARWSMIAVDIFGWVGLNNLMETGYSEDR